jgi:hypothetical protein
MLPTVGVGRAGRVMRDVAPAGVVGARQPT